MTDPCPYPCNNKTELGYCRTTGCINPHYQYIIFYNHCNNTIPAPCQKCSNHPMNGGTGFCNCTLGLGTIY